MDAKQKVDGGAKKREQANRPMFDRNKRVVVPNLPETHKLLTVVQFGDRAALLVRKRMSLSETGQLPASKALGLLEQYNTAIENYTAAVDAMCAVVKLDRLGTKKTADRMPRKTRQAQSIKSGA